MSKLTYMEVDFIKELIEELQHNNDVIPSAFTEIAEHVLYKLHKMKHELVLEFATEHYNVVK